MDVDRDGTDEEYLTADLELDHVLDCIILADAIGAPTVVSLLIRELKEELNATIPTVEHIRKMMTVPWATNTFLAHWIFDWDKKAEKSNNAVELYTERVEEAIKELNSFAALARHSVESWEVPDEIEKVVEEALAMNIVGGVADKKEKLAGKFKKVINNNTIQKVKKPTAKAVKQVKTKEKGRKIIGPSKMAYMNLTTLASSPVRPAKDGRLKSRNPRSPRTPRSRQIWRQSIKKRLQSKLSRTIRRPKARKCSSDRPHMALESGQRANVKRLGGRQN